MQISRTITFVTVFGGVFSNAETYFDAKSGIKPWVDINTPKDAFSKLSSRGQTWNLVFSDEFNVPGRNFSAGKDPVWTALDLPDGVNAALEYYSPDATTTVTDDGGRGVFQIKVDQVPDGIDFRVYNAYAKPPAFESHTMVSF